MKYFFLIVVLLGLFPLNASADVKNRLYLEDGKPKSCLRLGSRGTKTPGQIHVTTANTAVCNWIETKGSTTARPSNIQEINLETERLMRVK